ncbi:unnamed protein product [Lymnaea stagnalis]|uniref:Purple acid phosphatase n=1 Tax=Lymnaea stagnalis TaxID=6523 RepID=A0AAV2H8J6_LYMST
MLYYQLYCMFVCLLTLTQSFPDYDSHVLDTNKEDGEDTTPSVHLDNCCRPQHVHLSFGDTTNEMIIVWSTECKCVGEVRYGTHPWGQETKILAEYKYFIDQNKNGMHHLYRVKLQQLAPKTVYYYLPVNDENSAGPFYFQTPIKGNNWSPNFLMFGDLGIHANTIPSLINEALSGNYTALFHVGDFGYDLKSNDGAIGDYFMQLIEPVAAYIPYMTCPGNHEIDYGRFSHYSHRFSMPDSEWPIPFDKMWYSMDIGPVHFISYSTEVFFTNNGVSVQKQKDWLNEDLKKANTKRETTPWIVAFGHRPMYCSTNIGDDCSRIDSRVREGLEELFTNWSVDLIIQAHEHNYERLWPLYHGKVSNFSYINPDVPVQIITGAAGSIEGTDHFLPYNQPDWSAYRLDNKSLNSYGCLRVVNLTHIFWEQRSINNHTSLDSIWIIKERNVSLQDESDSYVNLSKLEEENLDNKKSQPDIISTNVAVFFTYYNMIVILCGLSLGLLLLIGIRLLFKHKRKNKFVKFWNVKDLKTKSTLLTSREESDSDKENL